MVMLLGLLVTGGVYSAFAPAQAEQTSSVDELVTQGRELFLVGCATCHGENGEGVLTGEGTQLGPPLVGVGAAAVDFQVGTGRMPLAEPGVQAPRKEPVYNEEEIAALAAYVASLGPGPGVPDEADYSLEGLSDDERAAAISLGGQIFLTNCTACHNFDGAGGAMPRGGYAPTLHGVEPKYVYEAMVTGPQQMPVFADGNLTSEERRDVIAYLQSIQENPNYGGFGLGSFGPVSEGLAAWMIGITATLAFAIWIAAHSTRTRRSPTDEAPTDQNRVEA
jgi:ubiquinol-cytochrome c reductase cytochrome c subunit